MTMMTRRNDLRLFISKLDMLRWKKHNRTEGLFHLELDSGDRQVLGRNAILRRSVFGTTLCSTWVSDYDRVYEMRSKDTYRMVTLDPIILVHAIDPERNRLPDPEGYKRSLVLQMKNRLNRHLAERFDKFGIDERNYDRLSDVTFSTNERGWEVVSVRSRPMEFRVLRSPVRSK